MTTEERISTQNDTSRSTMYDTLQELPLFKGVSRDVVTSFLESTRLEFKRYMDGDLLASEGDDCRLAVCIVSGNVRITRRIHNLGLEISETRGAGHILCAERLFGRDTHYDVTVCAEGECGVMRFSKGELTRLLQSEHVCLLNWLNLVALTSQRITGALDSVDPTNPTSWLAFLIDSTTNPKSMDIQVKLDNTSPFFQSFQKHSFSDTPLSGAIVTPQDNALTLHITDRAGLMASAT